MFLLARVLARCAHVRPRMSFINLLFPTFQFGVRSFLVPAARIPDSWAPRAARRRPISRTPGKRATPYINEYTAPIADPQGGKRGAPIVNDSTYPLQLDLQGGKRAPNTDDSPYPHQLDPQEGFRAAPNASNSLFPQ